MAKYLIILQFSLALFSCRQNSNHVAELDREKIVNSIRATLDNYYSGIKKNGLTAEFKYLDNSPDFFWVPPGYTSSISYDSVVAVLKQNAPNYKLIDNSFDTLSIIPLSNQLATYTGRINSLMVDTLGQEITFSLVETGVLIKRKDGWKLLNGQTSILKQQ